MAPLKCLVATAKRCPPHIPVSFGFDTACKTYATLVGNVAVDALSAQKCAGGYPYGGLEVVIDI